MSVYVDSHCHVDRYDDVRSLLRDSHHAGVVTIAVTELPSQFQQQEIRLRHTPGLRLAIGIHPLRAHHATSMELALFRRLIDRTDYVGEVGLDFSRQGQATREQQLHIFDAILRHPRIEEKVLSVHSRGAARECIDRLSDRSIPAILHWFSGPIGQVDRALEAGMFFSVNPAMLASKSGQRIIDRLPRERVLTETDGPYTRVEGRTADPRDIPWLVEQLARRWDIDSSEARVTVFDNMKAAFSAQSTKTLSVPASRRLA